MNSLRRLLRNVPVLRFGAAAALLALAVPAFAADAPVPTSPFAASPGGAPPALPPGWHNVSSLHTALQLLSMAGGVKDIGARPRRFDRFPLRG
jgi:hypothetical protein